MHELPVYVIHYRATEWCAETVQSIRASDIPVSVTVINNGGSAPRGVRVIETNRNMGYAGGANLAIREGHEFPLVAIASHDVMLEVSTLRRLVEVAVENPAAGVVGAAVGNFGELRGVSGPVEWRDWTSGSLLLLRQACIEEIGPFDERLESYCDDMDLGLRANDAGWKVARVTDAPASHRGSSAGSMYALRHAAANRVLLGLKRDGWRGFARSLASLVALTGRSVVGGLLPGRDLLTYLRAASAYIGAWGVIARRLPRFIRDVPSDAGRAAIR